MNSLNKLITIIIQCLKVYLPKRGHLLWASKSHSVSDRIYEMKYYGQFRQLLRIRESLADAVVTD